MSQAGTWRKTASGAGKKRGSPRNVNPCPEARLWASLEYRSSSPKTAGRHVRARLQPVVAERDEIDEREHDLRLGKSTRARDERSAPRPPRAPRRDALSHGRAHAVWSAGAGGAGCCSGAAEQPERPGTKRGTPAFTLTGRSLRKPRIFEWKPVAHGPCEQTGQADGRRAGPEPGRGRRGRRAAGNGLSSLRSGAGDSRSRTRVPSSRSLARPGPEVDRSAVSHPAVVVAGEEVEREPWPAGRAVERVARGRGDLLNAREHAS